MLENLQFGSKMSFLLDKTSSRSLAIKQQSSRLGFVLSHHNL